MSTPKIQRLERERFNYAKFYSDLNKACAAKKTTVKSLSVNRFYKGENYLDKAFASGTLAVNILTDLAAFIGVSLKEYEIKKTELVKPEPVKIEPVKPVKGWGMEVKVDTEYGVAMVRITKDGEKVCTGQSYLYGTDIVGIVQGISYATHMCYKMVQQGAIKETIKGKEQTAAKNDISDLVKSGERVIFKDWVKKFEKDASPYGRLARYVSNEYSTFPTKGEKEMKYYLTTHSGDVHMQTFKNMFSIYMSWCRANEAAI